ncbi:MAG: DinB family protein [Chitinophagaceae bacterium]
MILDIINKIKTEYENVFNELDDWCETDNKLLNYRLQDRGWSIGLILEHVSLTNHFLLILIRKGTDKALARAKKIDISVLMDDYDLDWDKLNQIGVHQSFNWNRPEHMEPNGLVNLAEIKSILHRQKTEALSYLNQLKNGEGILHETMMTVNNLGKIDVYHYIYFLVQHAKRHIGQMEKLKKEFMK